VSLACTLACVNPRVRSTLPEPPTPEQVKQLWVAPGDVAARDLFHGPGGADLAPEPGARFRFEELDTTGASRGYDVRDGENLAWSVKIGVEAQTEVVVSRLLWAVGYHQPPTYYLAQWTLEGGGEHAGPQPAGRFRPDLSWQRKVADEWSWHENPFVGTREYHGLLVANLLVNNWDLKPRQNKIYELERVSQGARRWFVVRDLGASLGKPRWPTGTKNDIDDYERHGFVRRVADGRIEFDYTGRHGELFRAVKPSDLAWICGLFSRLTEAQLHDAFRAAHYERALASRYIRRLRAKIDEGLRAAQTASGQSVRHVIR
jgi:hypothetical protein